METQKRIEELYKLYYERNADFEKAKSKRMWWTVIGFTVFYLIVLYNFCFTYIDPKIDNFGEEFGIIAILCVFSFIASWIHYWVNITIFGHISIKGREEYEMLQKIQNEINELKRKH